jgi:hypothetical protein
MHVGHVEQCACGDTWHSVSTTADVRGYYVGILRLLYVAGDITDSDVK